MNSENIFKVLWGNRQLIVHFAIMDVKLRYKNSVLGFVWSILEPLLMLTVLYFVFTNIFKSDQIENYALYLLLGLIIWYMFSRATTNGVNSLVGRSHIISKIYFQKEILVVSSCLSAFIMMCFEFLIFGLFLAIFNFVPPITIVFLPLILINLFILCLGISFLLSILNVYFRDIQFIWQVVLSAGFFLSPILYDLTMFPENIRQILKLNPMAPILDMAHSVVLYDKMPILDDVFYTVGITFAIFILGFLVFKFKSKNVAEIL